MHSRAPDRTVVGAGHDDSRARTSMRGPDPSGRSSQALLNLQSSAGNAAVVQMLRRAGHAGAQPAQHQHGAGCRHEQTGQPQVQRSAVHGVLRSAGRPMGTALREEMEARLGADFSAVRIHDDDAARSSAAEVGARAYTSGHHVVIGRGGADKHTLAHELTHVIQQRQGAVSGTDNGAGLRISDPSDTYEQAAESNARRVMSLPVRTRVSGEQADPATRSSPTARTPIQRVEWKNNRTQKALRTKKGERPGDPLVHTLHHIVPKSLLQDFAGLLSDAQRARVVTVLQPLAPTAFTSPSTQLDAVSKALKNIPANFALGPEPGNRNDDPGNAGPDLNYSTEDGAITPRSEQLERVYDFIKDKVDRGGPVTDPELETRFISPLVLACTAHNDINARLGLDDVGLHPGRTAWFGDGARRDQHRNPVIEPLL
ncbi:eCIS core domain-containing protein [Streptomyces sp. NPDC004393]|uniref:eCIS core domain-containing protein n=1 Tax=Streptomyces sp. NPDC004533 TaxID=3154278 RepID=UPI0033B72926